MLCTRCGLWELARGDLRCSWCGAVYLRFAVALEPATLPLADYPPPAELLVTNQSPLCDLVVERIHTDRPWLSLLAPAPLPFSLAPGAAHRFLLDADLFALTSDSADLEARATVTVSVRHAPEPATATLTLSPSL